MITTYTCPECRRLLRTTEALPGGTRVQCPQCRTEFATPEDAPEPPAPRAAHIPAVPRAGAKLVDEGWQSSGPAPRDGVPSRQAHAHAPRTRGRPAAKNSSRKAILAFVVICLGVAFLVLIIAMAQRRSQPHSQKAPMAQATPRLQGQWQLLDINGNPPDGFIHFDFRDDGSGRLLTQDLRAVGGGAALEEVTFRYRIVGDASLEMETHNLHGAPQFLTVYRIEWLHNNEMRLVNTLTGESFHCRR
jgi:hypothetical protein